MSSTMKLGLLALVSTAAAVPHYGHSQYHNKGKPVPTASGGAAYPTGGWWRSVNATAVYPTGTAPAVSSGELTTTIDETMYSTTTVVKTIWETRPAAPKATGPVAVQDFVSSAPGTCGAPQTVYVTATNRVTVTVGAGASSTPAASEATPSPSSSAPAYVAPPANKGAEEPSSASQVAYTPAPAASSPAPSEAPSAAPSVAPSSAAASSAAPAPTTPSYSGGKRGLAYNDIKLTSAFSGKASFAYNWAAAEGGQLPAGTKYIPMCHRPSLWPNPSDWFSAVSTAVQGGANAVMGFNEPDHAAQANLTPEQACSAWNTYLNPIASKFPGVTIIGPSVTNGPAPMGLDWLSRFAQACPGATWHAANIHFYDVYDQGTLGRFQAHIEQAAAQVGGKKIWVTEFGLNPGSATAAQAAEFLQGAMKYMDGSDVVQGYSYFMVGTGENQLNTASGLSSVGSVYAS